MTISFLSRRLELLSKLRLSFMNNKIYTYGHPTNFKVLDKRKYCTESRLKFQSDVQIPVPWGQMSAKVWGPENGTPILALHGWLDNAGSFDSLAPLLPSNIRLVCLESCGHGLSSPFPPGTLPSHFDYISNIKLVVDYFQWKNFIMMGHSMGGIMALYFSSVFPELVKKIICLDTFNQTSLSAKNLHANVKHVLTQFHNLQSRAKRGGTVSAMSYQQARNKLLQNYGNSLDEKSADILLIRGLKKVGEDRYEQTRDLRSIITPFMTEEELAVAAHSVRCPTLMIKARHSVLNELEEFASFYDKVYNDLTKKNFHIVEVDGYHHVHLTHPERVSSQISNFVLSKNI